MYNKDNSPWHDAGIIEKNCDRAREFPKRKDKSWLKLKGRLFQKN